MDPVSAVSAALGPLSQVVAFVWNCSSGYKVNQEEVRAFTRHVEDMVRFLRDADRKIARGGLAGDAVLKISTFTERVSALQKTVDALSKKSKVYRFLMHSSVSQQISSLYADIDRTMRACDLACTMEILATMNRQREDARKRDARSIHKDCEKIMQSRDILVGLGVKADRVEEAKIALRKRLPDVPQSPERQVLELAMQETERRSRNIPTLPDQYVITSLECVWFRDKRLGTGGYASVYLGTYYGTTVAVKVLNKGISHQVMDSEVEIWMKLRHPNILRFYGCCSFADPPFMVCEYQENGNINEYLRSKPDADRRKLLHDACSGLVHLHDHNIIHSDLKGSNILVNRAGTACLADFGLSRTRTESATIALREKKPQKVQGTVRWMSPERLKGASADKRSDIYSFAMTMYEVFAGAPPFTGIEDNCVQRSVCDHAVRPQRPPDPRTAARGLDDSMWAVVTRCWDQNPAARLLATQLLGELDVRTAKQGRPGPSTHRPFASHSPTSRSPSPNPSTPRTPAPRLSTPRSPSPLPSAPRLSTPQEPSRQPRTPSWMYEQPPDRAPPQQRRAERPQPEQLAPPLPHQQQRRRSPAEHLAPPAPRSIARKASGAMRDRGPRVSFEEPQPRNIARQPSPRPAAQEAARIYNPKPPTPRPADTRPAWSADSTLPVVSFAPMGGIPAMPSLPAMPDVVGMMGNGAALMNPTFSFAPVGAPVPMAMFPTGMPTFAGAWPQPQIYHLGPGQATGTDVCPHGVPRNTLRGAVSVGNLRAPYGNDRIEYY
ncbi:kinase-like domain-containing protein [Phanerochaete sordida]|uniref:Kinase-like domain-containing protein n=1 Tax=Phanerochaete sordida TaxID=48140 RepID=A0A9P3FZS0_9APHY|nr:kinase-like domain-containing protein [Phanerochaete sordida]